MMKTRIQRYLLFALMLIGADQLVGTMISSLAQKQTRDNRIGLLLQGQINADIMIIGSSRALNNYSPAVLQKETNLKCFNLGVSGSNILFHETMVDLVIHSNHKPKMIICNLDDYGQFSTVDGIVYRKDVLYPYVHDSIINDRVCKELNKKKFATYLSKTYRQNVNFINALKYLVYGRENPDYKTTNFDELGANLLNQRPEDHTPQFITTERVVSDLKVNQAYWQAFQRIQQKCSQNNIKLVLSLPPVFQKNTVGFKELIKSQVTSKAIFLDFSGQMQDAGFFFNPDHMNKPGAEHFTHLVATQIKSYLN